MSMEQRHDPADDISVPAFVFFFPSLFLFFPNHFSQTVSSLTAFFLEGILNIV